MVLSEAITEISTFWPPNQLPLWNGAGQAGLERIAKEFAAPLPQELATYVERYVPAADFHFEGIGNGITLYGSGRLKALQDGYSYNPLTRQNIDDWNRNWFLIADEGADPIIIDLSTGESTVRQARHGAGKWEFWPTSNSIAQFLVCAAAVHHALTQWPHDDLDDEEGDDIYIPAALQWLRPRLQRWAGEHFDRWYGGFESP